MIQHRCNVCLDYIIIAVEGSITNSEDANNLYALIKEQSKNGIKKVIIDLKKVNYISSIIVGFLIKINDELNNISGVIVLCNVQQAVLELLKITKVNLILQIFENQEKAVEYLSNL